MKFNFNLSYSSLSLYRKCPRTFYYTYIAKAPKVDDTCEVYGLAGNLVHSAIENYVNKKHYDFNEEWKKKGLNHEPGFNEQILSLPSYKKCVDNGIRIANMYRTMGFTLKTEHHIEFKHELGITIKGFIDIVAEKPNKVYLLDWKTNSQRDEEHSQQMLFYFWLIWKTTGKIPDKGIWYYVKIGKELTKTFTEKDIRQFDVYINQIIYELSEKGDDINQYSIGDYKTPFNGYISLIEGKVKIEDKPELITTNKTLKLVLKDAKIYLENVPDELIPILAKEFSYELKNSFFITRAMQKKGVDYDGIKRLFNVRERSLPIGFLTRLKDFLEKENIIYHISNQMEFLKEYPMPKELITDNVQRDYQEDAVEYALKEKFCTLEMATSSGKTLVAAELIRRNKGLTLFVVDVGVLLYQTKKEFEEVFGEEIGVIYRGKIDLQKVMIAGIQSIKSLINKKDPQMMKILANTKTLIVDEAHGSAADSYLLMSKYIYNADLRVGLTGTYERPDGNTMLMEAVVGLNNFQTKAKKLIEQGYIMKPNIWFFKYKNDIKPPILPPFTEEELTNKEISNKQKRTKYNLYYKAYIVNNDNRNAKAIELVDEFQKLNKNILIVVSEISHGELLHSQIKDSHFIFSGVKDVVREQWLDEMKEGQGKVIIGIDTIVQKGLNITNLDIGINLSGNDNYITTIQFLGRILRKHEGKEQCYYIDFYDEGEYFLNHTVNRIDALKKEGHNIKILK